MIKQAVILAGGKGTRLRPYTTVLPKPLMPIGEMPILEILIQKLKNAGITDIIIATGYLSHIIKAYFNDGSKFGVSISYSNEEKPLGTAGPLKLIKNLDENFLIMNGDLLTDISLLELKEYHLRENNLVSIAVYNREIKIDLGVLEIDETMQIKDYIEKPTYNFKVSMGIYAMNKGVLQYFPKEDYYDLPDLILRLIKEKVRISAFLFDGIWLDIGRPDDYEKALEIFESERDNFFK